ncbi:WD repeat-containing protein 6-like [Uranotaenia lowii]|uniref:WD repeat-containing protein 6-like n=1 Tax=Uranotaenia lowii TaxID=190385 RepID=UPI0024796A60|nr:WD repeat-containing protein 6-like [Uranotaenia lowii]
MRVQTDATSIRVVPGNKLLFSIGNELNLLHLSEDGFTRKSSLRVPEVTDKIRGIDFRQERSNYGADGSLLVLFHAGYRLFTVLLNQDNTFSECSHIPLKCNMTADMLFFPSSLSGENVLLMHSRDRIDDWISCSRLMSDGSTICLITAHGVAIRLTRLRCGAWFIDNRSICKDRSTLYCSTIVGDRWDDLMFLSGTALGLLVVWNVHGHTLCSVSAHNGVIFSIQCDLELGMLVTTSDDRSVKFWTMRAHNDLQLELNEKKYCFGHTARVFHSQIVREGDIVVVVSIGEDSNICLWSLDGELITKKRMEDGSTIWNSDYDSQSQTVFTCASNGNIGKFNIAEYLCQTSQVLFEDISPAVGNEYLSKAKFLANDMMVAVTNLNRIILFSESKILASYTITFKCSILDTFESRIFVAGGSFLSVLALNEKCNTISLVENLELSFVSDQSTSTGSPVKCSIIRSLHCCRSNDLILCDNNGRCLVYDLQTLKIKSSHQLPKSAERWLTSVYCTENHLLLADRNGNLFLFNRKSPEPIHKLSHLHGKLGITQIKQQESTPSGQFLVTSGHDGQLKTIFLHNAKQTLQLFSSRKTPITWIDRIDNGLIVGFNDSHFVVANGQEILFQVNCGGGHRYWDCRWPSRLIFIQHKRLRQVKLPMAISGHGGCDLLTIPRFGWYAKACNDAEVVEWSETVRLIISGGEDNIIRVDRLATSGDRVEMVPGIQIHSHISSIKALLCMEHPCERGKLLLISAGGRAQLCVTTLDMLTMRPKEELRYMLHASDSERSRWRTNRNVAFDPETRFMCVTAVSTAPQELKLFVGCSDGFLRQFSLSTEDDGSYNLHPTDEVYYGKCFLRLAKLMISGRSVILTMATDGLICFWDAENAEKPLYQVEHHSSGINSFDIWQLPREAGFLLATGGDDQSVVVSKIYLEANEFRFCIESQLRWEGAHSAQVTGIKFAGPSSLWSTSVDQTVQLWCFEGFQKMTTLKRLATCVADIKGLVVLPSGPPTAFVYGCGFEFLDLDEES